MLGSLTSIRGLFVGVVAASCAIRVLAAATPEDEWKVKREQVFDFAQEPTIQRSGDQVTIRFATKAHCDVTVAIEDANGKIIRYLASGVLGPNAPDPLASNSLEQSLTWDGKDEQGRYVHNADSCKVRVSLGLQAHYERDLLSEPKRRMGAGMGVGVSTTRNLPVPILAACPEGVVIAEGHGMDHVRLFDHDGKYLRTIYPFPANKVDQVQGCKTATFPNDGATLPKKDGFLRATLLTSGSTGQRQSYYGCMFGTGITAMAVQGKALAATFFSLNRLSLDGTSGGLPLSGPALPLKFAAHGPNRDQEMLTPDTYPNSIAFSPDGKYLYLTGYQIRQGVPGRNLNKDCVQAVMRMEYAENKAPELFVGNTEGNPKTGTDNKSFKDPTSVACDAQGRVYISDFGNDRIQVYDPSGKYLKSIKASRPARVYVNPKNGEIYVFSWMLMTDSVTGKEKIGVSKPTMVRLKSFDTPAVVQTVDLPLSGPENYVSADMWGGLEHQVVVDFWSNPVRIWICSSSVAYWMEGVGEPGGSFGAGKQNAEVWDRKNVIIFEEKGGKLQKIYDFGDDVKKTLPRSAPPFFWRQRLHVDPTTGKLYVAEGNRTRWFKAFHELLEVDPATGAGKIIELPYSAEDAAFDLEGMLYLRNNNAISRWELESMREVPFDYGEEKKKLGLAPDSGGRKGDTKGAIPLMSPYISEWHNGGMWVSPKGNIVVACLINKEESLDPNFLGTGQTIVKDRKEEQMLSVPPMYSPVLFPGRVRCGEVHVYDRKGKLLFEDAIPGVRKMFGIAMDRYDNLYVLSHGGRVLSYGKVFEPRTGTLLKVEPKKSKTFTDARSSGPYPNPPIPLTDALRPKRPYDLLNGLTGEWVENCKWMYGGLIFSGKGDTDTGGGCSCWNGRFSLDLYGRSFAPETDHYSVAVLDSNGNLIMRIGRYGNLDSAGPKSAVPLGGDEIGLFHPQYVGVHTDRRLFIADGGNARIVSATLDYHTTKVVPLGR